MSSQRTSLAVLIATAIFLTLPFPSPAQPGCPRLPSESDREWADRCYYQQVQKDVDRSTTTAQQRSAETARQRAALEKQPPLPASRNRLLGRWDTSSRAAASGNPFEQIGAMVLGCGLLLTDGIIEFGPDRWTVHDSNGRTDMGPISYRAGANGTIYGLPVKGNFELMPFEFDNADQARFVGLQCTLRRTTATVPAGRSTRGPSAAPSAPRGVVSPASPPAAEPTRTRSSLDRISLKRGHDCPDGPDIVVDSCTGQTDDAKCTVVNITETPRNGPPVTFIETYGALVKRIARCKDRPLTIIDQKLTFMP